MPPRDYAALALSLPPNATREPRMLAVVDALWQAFGHDRPGPGPGGGGRQISWVGFYLKSVASDEMTLGPRRDKPACSPIGLHGACGQCFTSRRPLVVTDVAHLGEGYIACDPRDRAEVVIPCLDTDGSAWGVLDIDSYDTSAFTAHDAAALAQLLGTAGLSAPITAAPVVV